MKTWSQVEGSPFPLGATWIEQDQSFNFSLYSKHAHTVHLLFYSADNATRPTYEYEFDYLTTSPVQSGTAASLKLSRRAHATTLIGLAGQGQSPVSTGTILTSTRSCSIPTQRPYTFPKPSIEKQPDDRVPTQGKLHLAFCPAKSARSIGRMIRLLGTSRTW